MNWNRSLVICLENRFPLFWLEQCKTICAPQSERPFPKSAIHLNYKYKKASILLMLKFVVRLAVMQGNLWEKFIYAKAFHYYSFIFYFSVESVEIHKTNWIQFSVLFAFMQRFCVCLHYRECSQLFCILLHSNAAFYRTL